MKKSESQILFDIGYMHRKLIAKEVIQDLKNLNDEIYLLSGDDSGLKNVWEEICVQIQDDYSFHWDVYEDTIENFINGSLSKQAKEVIELLLYIGNIDFDEEEPEYFQENIVEDIKADILLEAEYYKNNNITNFLEQNFGDEDEDEGDDDDDEEEEEEIN